MLKAWASGTITEEQLNALVWMVFYCNGWCKAKARQNGVRHVPIDFNVHLMERVSVVDNRWHRPDLRRTISG
jgi:hypothetical protein